ncbi:pro-head protease [Escherichia coli]|uniref:Pro-head protease n=1 Tax=Escherichia coli TaxID=562 RepID=A0A484YW36_ECOLX|nr:pro-head protease [Escherichia coli]
MKAGSLTGLSIGYVLKDWEYDRSKEAFLLKEIDLWEVSLVTFPSNGRGADQRRQERTGPRGNPRTEKNRKSPA